MIEAGQRYIERVVSQVGDVNTLDLAHSTGTQGIVSFHVHNHGNGGNVTKASDNIGMEDEEAAQERIICRYTSRKLEKFLHERIDEGVRVPWLFGTRYDPSTKNVVLLEAFIWRKIVIENEEDPCSMFPLFEGSKAVHSKTKGYIMII